MLRSMNSKKRQKDSNNSNNKEAIEKDGKNQGNTTRNTNKSLINVKLDGFRKVDNQMEQNLSLRKNFRYRP